MPQPLIGEAIHHIPDDLASPDLAERIERLKAHHTIRESEHQAAFDAQQTVRADLGAAEGLLGKAKAERRPDQRAIAKQETEVERLKRQAKLIAERTGGTASAANVARRIYNRCVDYLPLAGNLVKPPKIKGDPDTVVANCDVEAPKVEKAPPPIEESIAEATRQIDAMGTADITVHIDHKGRVKVGWPIAAVNAEPKSDSLSNIPNAPDARPFIVELMRDKLVATATAAIEAKYAGSKGMSEADKRRRLAELADQRLAADRVRCQRIWDSGQLDFPADADPRAILGCDGPAPRADRN